MNCSFFEENPEEPITLKGILSDRSRRSWFSRKRKKSVQFSETRSKSASKRKNSGIEQKWRKYVQCQFKTLMKHRQNRWLGRGKKRSRKPKSTDFTGKSGRGASSMMIEQDDSCSYDDWQPFQFPPPGHKKRKKKSTSRSKSRRKSSRNKARHWQSREEEEEEENQDPHYAEHDDHVEPLGCAQHEADSLVHLKRPPNAFLLFSKACRQEFRNYMVPPFESKVVAMVLGHVWRYLSKDERTVFYDEAEEYRARFLEQRRRLARRQREDEGEGEDLEEEAERESKRPMNGFLLFCNEQRALIKRTRGRDKGRQGVRLLARKWNKMKPPAKRDYIDRARELSSSRAGYPQEENHQEIWCNRGGTNDEYLGDEPPVRLSDCVNNNKWSTHSSDSGHSHSQSSSGTRMDRPADPDDAICPEVNSSSSCNNGMQGAAVGTTDEVGVVFCDAQLKETDDSQEEEARRAALSISAQNEDIAECCLKMKPGGQQEISESGSAERGWDTGTGGPGSSRENRRKRKKKRKPRVSKVVKRHVVWKDEVQPWDVYNPLSSALCDEDVCQRMYGAGTGSRDDSWLMHACHARGCGPVAAHHGCYMRGPAGAYGARPSASCLSLDSMRKRVESNFLRAEQELANVSSTVSSSSLFDLYHHVLYPDMLTSSSDDDFNLDYILDNTHLSDQDNLNFAHFWQDDLVPYSCWCSRSPYCMSAQCHYRRPNPVNHHSCRNTSTTKEPHRKQAPTSHSNVPRIPRPKLIPRASSPPDNSSNRSSNHPDKGNQKSRKDQQVVWHDQKKYVTYTHFGFPKSVAPDTSSSSCATLCLNCKEIRDIFSELDESIKKRSLDNGGKMKQASFSSNMAPQDSNQEKTPSPQTQEIKSVLEGPSCNDVTMLDTNTSSTGSQETTARDDDGMRPAGIESEQVPVSNNSNNYLLQAPTEDTGVFPPLSVNTEPTFEQPAFTLNCWPVFRPELHFHDEESRVTPNASSTSRTDNSGCRESAATASEIPQTSRSPSFRSQLPDETPQTLNSGPGPSQSLVSMVPRVSTDSVIERPSLAQSVSRQMPQDLELEYCQFNRWL